jgi:peptide chain release factor 2
LPWRTGSTISGTLFDYDAKLKELERLEAAMASPGFWDNKEKAQETVKALRAVKQDVLPLQSILKTYHDMIELCDLAEAEGNGNQDEETLAELQDELRALTSEIEKLEFRRMLSGPNDAKNAYVSIHAGAGGTEACDWAAMLLRMYNHWLERHGYKVEIVDSLAGEEAGLRRVTLHIAGEWAYGYLKSEIGVHRLVRISPFDANARRHTSFASVDVVPEVDEDIEIEIKDEDLKVDTFRAGGAGGQHVNKTSSAVRITHLPTGIVVQCQNERSQHKNRKMALSMLKAKLYQMKERERMAEIAAAYDEKGEIAWGHQIRSYVLQPYTMVKDLRTDAETGNAQAVLDGEIDMFIEAYLKQQMRAAASQPALNESRSGPAAAGRR